MKGQTVADFFGWVFRFKDNKLYKDLPNEVAEVCLTQTSFEGQVWQLFFDDASRTGPWGNIAAWVGVVLVSPQNYIICRAFSLTESCSHNVVEYNALLIGMHIPNEIGVKNLKAYGDSKLIVNQVHGEYEVRHKDLVPDHNATIHMAERFRSFCIDHVPRQQNAHADALESLACFLGPSSRRGRESTHL